MNNSPWSPLSAHTNSYFSQKELLKLRFLSIDDPLTDIRSRSTVEKNKYVFEDLTKLQKSFCDHSIYGKRDLESQQSDIYFTIEIENENLLARIENEATIYSDSPISYATNVILSTEKH